MLLSSADFAAFIQTGAKMGVFSPQVEARAGMWYNEAGGEGTPVRKKASKKLRILLEPRLALILLIAIAAGVVFAALWGPLRPGSRPEPRLLLFWACGALPVLACFVWALCCQAVVDARGVRVRPARERGGALAWREVRSVCVLRAKGSAPRLCVSRIPGLDVETLRREQPPGAALYLPYSRRCLAVVRRYYRGKIVTLRPAEADADAPLTARALEMPLDADAPKTYRFLLFWPMAVFAGAVSIAFAWMLARMGVFTRAGFAENPFAACLLLLILISGLACCAWLCACRVTMDARGVRSHIPGRRDGNGFIPWKEARCAGVFRTVQGERLLFVSRLPNVWVGRDMMANDLPLDELIKMGYSRRRLAVIRRYCRGEIVELV